MKQRSYNDIQMSACNAVRICPIRICPIRIWLITWHIEELQWKYRREERKRKKEREKKRKTWKNTNST